MCHTVTKKDNRRKKGGCLEPSFFQLEKKESGRTYSTNTPNLCSHYTSVWFSRSVSKGLGGNVENATFTFLEKQSRRRPLFRIVTMGCGKEDVT